MEIEEILEKEPFGLAKEEKEVLLTDRLKELTGKHAEGCGAYAKMLEAWAYAPEKVTHYRELPFLPVRLFKQMELRSVPEEAIIKTMTSSGTSSQTPSKIFLDRKTSAGQQKAMVKIVSDFTGSSRMPMVIIDSPSVLKNRASFSARGAGILGFSIFGNKKFYALDEEMHLNAEGLKEFLEQNRDKQVFLFGFTFMIWQHFYRELVRLKEKGISFDLSHAVMIHGGGWKKLESEAVSREAFHKALQEVCGLSRIHDYYGMVEQTGCIYMECECGHLHASSYSDVIMRRPLDFGECKVGEEGIIEVVSTLPESYPGHSLLTEDRGVLLGEDDCPCGRKGKYFKVLGRLKNAEIRGCSDTYGAGLKTSKSEDSVESGETDAAEKDGIPKKISFISGGEELIGAIKNSTAFAPFDERIMTFMEEFSSVLRKDVRAKRFPDLAAFSFWIRRASLEGMKKEYEARFRERRMGRGLSFHIAPSNVAMNFAYSFSAALLAGNTAVVRLPGKRFPQVDIFCSLLDQVLENYPEIRKRILLVRYEREKGINDYFSAMVDIRVIWGGDATIRELRRSELPPRSVEITFSDRYSLAVLDSDAYMAAENKTRIATDFYNDTYLSDQNACSSPRLLVWTGRHREEAAEAFWQQLEKLICDRYDFQDIQGVDKLSSAMYYAAEHENTRFLRGKDLRLVRLKLSSLDGELREMRDAAGFFYEYDCADIKEIFPYCDDVRCQTIVYYGDEGMFAPLLAMAPRGIDRIVPVGHSMDFELLWDGYDLLEQMSRVIRVR